MRQLDARGLKCPLPVLKARRLVEEMADGELVEILTTDPGAPQDFQAFADIKGYSIIEKTVDEKYNARLILKKTS